MQHVIALVHEENERFGVSFPDFPGAVTSGGSIEEALRRAADVLSFHAAGMVEDGEALPRLRSHAELLRDPDFLEDSRGGVLAFVQVELPGKAVRVNVSLDEHLLSAIDRAARESGMTRSAFIAESTRRRLVD